MHKSDRASYLIVFKSTSVSYQIIFFASGQCTMHLVHVDRPEPQKIVQNNF